MSMGRLSMAAIVIAMSMSLGCGEDDSQAGRIAAKHNTICDMPIMASNCPDDVDLAPLVFLCKTVSAALLDTPECNAKIDAYIECNKKRTWACQEGGEVPLPESPDPCSDIVAPFTLPDGACIDQTKVNQN